MAVGDHHGVECLDMLFALGIEIGDAPRGGAARPDGLNRVIEPDMRGDPEAPRVALEIGLKLPVIGVIRVTGRHREVFVFRPGFRAYDVRVFVDAGMARLGIENPIAANLVVFLENDKVQASLNAVLTGCNA